MEYTNQYIPVFIDNNMAILEKMLEEPEALAVLANTLLCFGGQLSNNNNNNNRRPLLYQSRMVYTNPSTTTI
jgi:hypothetical protein